MEFVIPRATFCSDRLIRGLFLAFSIVSFATIAVSAASADPLSPVPGYSGTSVANAGYNENQEGQTADVTNDANSLLTIQSAPIASLETETTSNYYIGQAGANSSLGGANAVAGPNQVEVSASAEGYPYAEDSAFQYASAESTANFFDSITFVDPSKTGQSGNVTANLNVGEVIFATGSGYAYSSVETYLFEGNNLNGSEQELIDQDEVGAIDLPITAQTTGVFSIIYGQQYTLQLAALDTVDTGVGNTNLSWSIVLRPATKSIRGVAFRWC